MKHYLRNIWRAAPLAACLGAAGLPMLAAPALADPLATPARGSALASRALMLALAPAGTRLVAAGERGIVIVTDDGGTTWRQARVPVGVTLTAMHFADASHGVAVGHDGVLLATRDGGLSWDKRLDGNQINEMMLAEAEQGAVRANAALAGARDATAAQQAVDQADNALHDMQDAVKSGPSRPLLAVWFRNRSLGWAVGSYGQALRTRDGGAHWESIAGRLPNPEGLHYNAIGHGADGALYLAGEGGKVYRSGDDGDSWRSADSGYKGQLYGVTETAPGALLAYGFGGHVLRSEDAGASWQELPRLGDKSLIGAVHDAGGALLLAARDGTMYRSADQGHSFAAQAPARRMELAAMALQGSTLALAGMGGVHLSVYTNPK
ncbi:MAG: YCF48-related protein [Pseudomonadota bacterium]